MKPAPLVDVIIPTFDSARFVGDAVSSALDQSWGNQRIIVVDDGSRDSTSRVLAAFEGQITVIRHPQNRGLPAARNSGIRAGEGDLIAFLDADDVWLPGKTEAQVEHFLAHPEVGLCFTGLTDCDEELRPVMPPRKMRRRVAEDVFEELYLQAFPIPPSTVVMRRSLIEEAGLFDERMLKAQDYEYWLRISMCSPVSCLPESTCWRRLHGGSITNTASIEKAMSYESLCFEACEAAAARMNRKLPISAHQRTLLSRRRRMYEFLRAGRLEAAAQYRGDLESNSALRLWDRAAYRIGWAWAALRGCARPPRAP